MNKYYIMNTSENLDTRNLFPTIDYLDKDHHTISYKNNIMYYIDSSDNFDTIYIIDIKTNKILGKIKEFFLINNQ